MKVKVLRSNKNLINPDLKLNGDIKARPFNIDIGNRIRTARIQKGFASQQLATLLSISNQQMYKYESGIDNISAEKLLQIAKITGKSANYFYDIIADVLPNINTNKNTDLKLFRLWQSLSNTKKEKILKFIETCEALCQ